ncbi:fibroblast growth factor receptor 1-like isoform X4 [Oculina patagonica]
MLLFGFVLVICPGLFFCNRCVTSDQVIHIPKAPPVAIHIAEFPDDDVIPVGYNLTIACTGNSSREGDSQQFSEQPFQIHLFFRRRQVKTCGGSYSDREDTKTCKLHIKEASRNDSGEYGCMVSNFMKCSIAVLTLNLEEPSKPRFVIHPIAQDNFLTGKKANFSCEALGIPRPVITWFKDGRRIPKDRIKVENKTFSLLTIESVELKDQGEYWCEANSDEGWNRSAVANLTVTDNRKGSSRSPTIVWASVGSVVFAIILAALVYMLRRFWCRKNINKPDAKIAEGQDDFLLLEITRDTLADLRDDHTGLGFQEADQSTRDENEVTDDETYLRELGIDRDWQIPREKLEITGEKLGRGEFAMVNKGFYMRRDGRKLPVAVKTLKDNNNQTDRLALISEIETLAKVGRHPNIVSLVGACTFEEPLCVVVEFIPGGSLDKLLRKSQVHRCMGEEHPPYANIWSRLTERELLQIASDIANGMKHLESKLCVHRDLAARNILVGKGLIAKVADFGMARDVSKDGEYIKTTEGRIPWLWMPIEALRGRFTTMSDV